MNTPQIQLLWQMNQNPACESDYYSHPPTYSRILLIEETTITCYPHFDVFVHQMLYRTQDIH